MGSGLQTRFGQQQVSTRPYKGFGGFGGILEPYQGGKAHDLVRERLELLLTETRAKQIAFSEWAQKVPEPKGPLSFTRFPFQRELYQSGFAEREMVVQKGTQVGVSAFLIRWTLFWCDTRGATGLYIFPRERQLLDFSDARIRPLIAGVKSRSWRSRGDRKSTRLNSS